MTENQFRIYTDYRDAAADFLPRVPAHWEVIRAGALFREIVDTGHPELELLSINRFVGITKQSETGRKTRASKDRSAYKRIRPGELGYNLMNAFMGSIGVSTQEGILSPAYAVARPRREIEPSYFHYLYRTPLYQAQFERHSYGIMYERNRLYFDRFKTIPTLIPPLDEQRPIVGYLRTQDRQIAKLIRGKRWLIELLNEQKQIIIHRAVTRGLNPGVPLKPSGIDWLGDVPAHWEICPLKAIGNVQFSGVDKHSHDDELPIKLCNYTDVYKNDFITSDMNFMVATATEAEISRFRLAVGDVLLTKDSETPDDIGVPALVRSMPESGVVCGYHLAMIRPKAMIAIGEFIFRALSDRVVARQFHLAANGVTRFGLAKADVKKAVIPLPRLNEQKKICAHIAAEFAPINESIAATKREIALIREYRDRLISDVVTGQIDVRGWQPEPDAENDTEILAALSEADENDETLDEEEEGNDA